MVTKKVFIKPLTKDSCSAFPRGKFVILVNLSINLNLLGWLLVPRRSWVWKLLIRSWHSQ